MGGSVSLSCGLCSCEYGWEHNFFLWCLAGEQQLLSKFSVTRLPLSLSFGWRQPSFVGWCFFFPVYTHCCFQVTGFFSSKSGIHEAKGKSRQLTCIVCWVPRSLKPVFLHLSTLQRLCFIYNIPCFSLHWAREIRKSTSTPSYGKPKSSLLFFLIAKLCI